MHLLEEVFPRSAVLFRGSRATSCDSDARCRVVRSDVHAPWPPRMSSRPGTNRPNWLWPMVTCSGCRRDASHPVRHRRRHLAARSSLNGLRLDAFAIAACGPAEPIGTLLTRRRHTTNLTSPARFRRLRRANSAPMSLIATVARSAASFNRDASLEVSSPSALASSRRAVRSSRAADDPASAFSLRVPTRASADLREATSPLRFFALRMRCGEAR